MVGIWLVGIEDNTVVWTAKRDDPPVTSNATTLDLTESGKLLLTTDEQGDEKIISATMSESASYACMIDSGNFVLYNKNDSIIWETFRYPTDTILGGQILSGCQLLSSLSDTNNSTGRYHLKMQIDGNLVLHLVNTLDIETEAYWASGTNGNNLKYHLYLSHTGILQIINSTSMNNVQHLSSSLEGNSTNTIYHATLDVNGFFQLY